MVWKARLCFGGGRARRRPGSYLTLPAFGNALRRGHSHYRVPRVDADLGSDAAGFRGRFGTIRPKFGYQDFRVFRATLTSRRGAHRDYSFRHFGSLLRGGGLGNPLCVCLQGGAKHPVDGWECEFQRVHRGLPLTGNFHAGIRHDYLYHCSAQGERRDGADQPDYDAGFDCDFFPDCDLRLDSARRAGGTLVFPCA